MRRWHCGTAPAALLIVTGGLDDDPERSIAAAMRTRAIAMGVPGDAITMVGQSANTFEDIAGSLSVIHQRERRGPVLIVTSALHMRRTLAVATRAGIASANPWPCGYRQSLDSTWRAWLPNNGRPRLFAQVLHEVIGLFAYRWQGRA